MKKRKILYIYTDKNDIIQRIETFSIDVRFTEHLVPEDQESEFLELKKQWDLAYGYKPATILMSEDGIYKPKRIIHVYFYKETFVLKCISPVMLKEYDDNETLAHGIAEITSLINGFIAGKKNLAHYKVEQNGILLDFIERKIQQDVSFKEVSLLKNSKIDFIKRGREIELRYNRKKKELLIHCIDVLPMTSIMLYFTKKHDRTVLYQSIEATLYKGTELIEDINLPKNFDVYSSLSTKYRFLYKEENGKRKSYKNVNK